MGTAHMLETEAGVTRGRRLLVSLSGSYNRAVNDSNSGFYLDCGHGNVFIPDSAQPTVDILPDPEPDWWPPQPGDVIVLDGTQWMRRHILGNHAWVTWHHTSTIGDDSVLTAHRRGANLRLIARNEQPHPQ